MRICSIICNVLFFVSSCKRVCETSLCIDAFIMFWFWLVYSILGKILKLPTRKGLLKFKIEQPILLNKQINNWARGQANSLGCVTRLGPCSRGWVPKLSPAVGLVNASSFRRSTRHPGHHAMCHFGQRDLGWVKRNVFLFCACGGGGWFMILNEMQSLRRSSPWNTRKPSKSKLSETIQWF